MVAQNRHNIVLSIQTIILDTMPATKCPQHCRIDIIIMLNGHTLAFACPSNSSWDQNVCVQILH